MIPLARPDITYDEVADDIKNIIQSGWLTSGEYLQRFEKCVADYVGVRHAIATTSATTALHLSLVTAGIGEGDEVLVSDFTFPASGNAIVQAGATPVFVDCAPGRFTIDVEDARRKITKKTRAIMPVDPFGHPADLKSIAELGLFVIEDAACAIGSKRDGHQCGSWPGVGCFSFHPRKIITTGEGGMLTTNDDNFAAYARRLRSHGGVQNEVGMSFIDNGYNYRMSEIQAALGLSQMKKLDNMISERHRIAALYSSQLSQIEELTLPLDREEGIGTFQSYAVMLSDRINRNKVVASMRKMGIETTLGTYAMHSHPAFARYGYSAGDLRNSFSAQQHSLTLPLIAGMTENTISKITKTLTQFIIEQLKNS